jgi:hypothetical protein
MFLLKVDDFLLDQVTSFPEDTRLRSDSHERFCLVALMSADMQWKANEANR